MKANLPPIIEVNMSSPRNPAPLSDRPVVQAAITADEIEYLLAYLFRCPEVFQAACQQLRPEHFREGAEPHYALLWRIALTLYQEHGLPALFEHAERARGVVETQARAYATAHPELLVGRYQEILFGNERPGTGLFNFIYNPEMRLEDLSRELGHALLRKFLHEREVGDSLRRLVANTGTQALLNPSETLTQLQARAQQIDMLSERMDQSIFPGDWAPQRLDKFPTGLSFLDEHMEGGQCRQEVYGILGAIGVGKTQLACQMAMEAALFQETNSGWGGDVVLCHYEAGVEEIRRRVLAAAVEMPPEQIENFDAARLSTTGRLKEYERRHFADKIRRHQQGQGPPVLGERERIATMRQILARNLVLMDLSCPPGRPRQGMGYIPEIATGLRQRQQATGRPIAVVIIDYAGLCANRYLYNRNLPASQLGDLIGSFGDQCRTQIAVPFDCAVWVFHQLSGEANKASFRQPLSHADAAEARNFAENLWFCFTMGIPHRQYGCFKVACTKQRRGPRLGREWLLHNNGLGRIVDVSQEYATNEAGDIIPVRELAQPASQPPFPRPYRRSVRDRLHG
jgi:hypothetical protein